MQVHVEEIARVESAVGNDRKKGTWIYLRDGLEPRYCEETAQYVREMIAEAKSKEELHLDSLAIGLLLQAADESADGGIHFDKGSEGLTVAVGGNTMDALRGRDRSEYEHAEEQLSSYALLIGESQGVYRLNMRGYQLAEFLVASKHPQDQPFKGFVKLTARPSSTPAQIGIQINQKIVGAGTVNTAVSEQGDVEQSVK